jgi:hypothetical protein
LIKFYLKLFYKLPFPSPRNVCGCLKNLAFGRANDANKLEISRCGGVKALAGLLRASDHPLVHEEASGALWNISSADELKVILYFELNFLPSFHFLCYLLIDFICFSI